MLDVLADIIQRHRATGVLVDTNLLLVFLMAAWNENVALRFKRTQGYTKNDLILLRRVLTQFDRLIVTPAVLGEVSNLAGQLPRSDRTAFFNFLAQVLPIAPFNEQCIDMENVAAAPCFIRLGFADATIEQLGAMGVPVLTDDVPLYAYLAGRDIDAFNFNHIRNL